MIVQDVIDKLERQSPIDAAMEWDNVGLLVGDANKEVKRIYIALDATDEVIKHAADVKADMLITHHPLIFSGMKSITSDDFIGRRVISLVKNDMAYYAIHTNFDVYGMGALAQEALGLIDALPLDISHGEEGIGRIGNFAVPIKLKKLAAEIKKKFKVDAVRVYGDVDSKVQKIAISPGSGKSEIDNAIEQGADVLITGDIGHHDGIDSVARGMAIIDAGHYGLEHLFIDYMAYYLGDGHDLSGIKIFTEEKCNPYYTL